MADTRSSRDKQALDEEKRQRERAIAEAVARSDEAEPPVAAAELTAFEAELEAVEFPATGAELVRELGEYEVESKDGTYRVEALLADTDVDTFVSAAGVRLRVQRPTVAAVMKRILTASESLTDASFRGSQWDAYEKSFRALKAIDADDDDEGVEVVADWIHQEIDDTGTLPGSRRVRKRAARFCRENGYEIRDDQWLGA